MSEINYARAQARYLKHKFPNELFIQRINLDLVDRVEMQFTQGRVWSSVTLEEGGCDIVVYQTDGQSWFVTADDGMQFDLTEMVIEGLRLEQQALNVT